MPAARPCSEGGEGRGEDNQVSVINRKGGRRAEANDRRTVDAERQQRDKRDMGGEKRGGRRGREGTKPWEG